MTRYDFVDDHHANGYLANSVVRYEGLPVTVTHATARTVSLVGLGEKSKPITGVPVEELDLTPVPLGMCNMMQGDNILDAIYIMRVPHRRWKVGLTIEALDCRKVRNHFTNPFGTNDYTTGDLWGKPLARCIKGEYPSLPEALHMMRHDQFRSIAVSRHFAVDAESKLYYGFNFEPVGGVAGYGATFLDPKYRELHERLQEEVNDPA